MPRRHRLRRAALAPLFAAAAVVAWAPPAVAGAAVPLRGGTGDLSARLTELAKPSVHSTSRAGQARALGLPAAGPGSLLREGNRVLVDVRFEDTGGNAPPVVDALRAAGAEVLHVSRRYRTVAVAAKPAELLGLRDLPGVEAVTEVLTPIVDAVGGPVTATTPYVACFGRDTSEGDVQLAAAAARAKFEVAGTGIKVGILSDSFDQDALAPTGATEDVASGDLPGPGNPCGHTTKVEVLDDSESEGEDEGRAMAQIVHDLAPGAALSFATAFIDEPSFADNIRALASKGAKVIVDDVSYLEDPFFQEGPVGVAASEVTTSHDVAYFAAAGNDNLLDEEGHEIGSWEAPGFRDSGGCPPAVVALGPGFNPHHCMDFNPAAGPSNVDDTFGITVEPGEVLIVDLQWAEPWEGVASDFDAFLLGPGGELLTGSAEENVTESQRPFEAFGWENETGGEVEVQLAINRFSGTSPRLKFILVQNGGGVSAIEYPESAEGDVVGPTIFGHNGGEDVMSLGAIRFNNTTEPEFFSSRGPATHYYGPVNGPIPALPLGSPEELAKPDVVATDGGANTFFGSCGSGVWRFFGTSAAAPHAAAIAALEREAGPLASAATVEEAQREGAAAVGTSTPAEVGAGVIDAVATLEHLGLTPSSATPAPLPAQGLCLPPRKPPAPPPSGGSSGGSTTSAATPDTTPPRTFFRKHPPKLIRTHATRAKAVFLLGADESDVSFVCRIDGGLFRPCPARLVKRFKPGWHSVRAAARDAAGNADLTPAVYRFRVKRIG